MTIYANFLKYLRAEKCCSPHTIRSYAKFLRDWFQFLDAVGIDWDKAGRDDVRRHLRDLSVKSPSAATQRLRMSACSAFYNWAISNDLVSNSPFVGIRMPKIPKRLPKSIEVEQVITMLENPVQDDNELLSLRNKAMLELMYSSGLRAAEVVALNWDDIDFSSGWVNVQSGKGGKNRHTPVGGHAINALKLLKNSGEECKHVFANSRGGRITTRALWDIVHKTALANGLKDISPHDFRHACATHMLDGGADIRVVQEHLGHSSISTTQRYTQRSNAKLLEIYAKNHPHAKENYRS